jgi:hypothetical protein
MTRGKTTSETIGSLNGPNVKAFKINNFLMPIIGTMVLAFMGWLVQQTQKNQAVIEQLIKEHHALETRVHSLEDTGIRIQDLRDIEKMIHENRLNAHHYAEEVAELKHDVKTLMAKVDDLRELFLRNDSGGTE